MVCWQVLVAHLAPVEVELRLSLGIDVDIGNAVYVSRLDETLR